MVTPFRIKVGSFFVVLVCSLIIFGCGSDNNSGVSLKQKAQKTAKRRQANVVELLTGNPSKQGAKKFGPSTGMESPNLEVTPPSKPGEMGVTRQEIEAAIRASRQIDWQNVEVIPPSKPGGHGITQRQIDALKPLKKIDPKSIEVIPPSKPGERGLTQQQIDALKPPGKNSARVEIIPPSKPGGRGLTQQEVDALRASQKKPIQNTMPPPVE